MKKLILTILTATMLFSCNTNPKTETIKEIKSHNIVK